MEIRLAYTDHSRFETSFFVSVFDPYCLCTHYIVKIVFWQDENNGPSLSRPLPIIKVLEQCSQCDSPKEISITLNQEETLRFVDDRKAYVQLRGSTLEGVGFGSRKRAITVYPVYDDSILDDEILPTPDYDGWVVLDGSNIG
jgi:hypothetical protein